MKRLGYIDNAKGILIIMMVCGHVFLEGPVRQFIYVFHMPAFLIISGMLSSNTSVRTIGEFLKSRTYSLLIPFVFFEIIGVLTDIICNGFSLNIKGYIYNSLTLNCNNGPDGFLIHMFGAEVLFYMIQKLPIKDNGRKILGLIFMLLAFVLPSSITTQIRIMVINCGFKIIGFYFYKKYSFKKKGIILALMGTWLISFWGLYVDYTYGNPTNIIIYILGALLGTYFVIGISKQIICKSLSYYGQNSLIILGTHNLLLLPIRAHIRSDFSIAMGVGVFIIIIGLEFPLIYFCNRFIPFLVGKSTIKCRESIDEKNEIH